MIRLELNEDEQTTLISILTEEVEAIEDSQQYDAEAVRNIRKYLVDASEDNRKLRLESIENIKERSNKRLDKLIIVTKLLRTLQNR